MPLGIVSDEEFDREVENSHPDKQTEVKIPEVLPMERPGRHEGDVNVPDSLRKIIGEESVINGRAEALEIARNFGISPSSVSAYANGSTSTSSMDKQPNLDHLNKARSNVARRARRKLMQSLSNLTDEKMQEAKAGELASVARSMSSIIKEMEPEDPKANKGANAPQIVVFAPQVRDERHYEILHVGE